MDRYQKWRDARRFPSSVLPPALRGTLLAPGSLTAQLKARCPGRFAVHLLRHDKVRIIGEDARLLGLPQAAPGRVREVYLYCGDRPVVFAHSILPTQALQGGWQYLTGLGSRPLGEVLFSDKTVRRGKIEVTQLRPGSALYAQVLARSSTKRPPSVWGRRSLFYLPQGALMVCEFFLPDFF